MDGFNQTWALLRGIYENELVQRLGIAILEVGCVGALGVVPLFAAAYLQSSDPSIPVSAATLSLRNLIELGQLYLYSFSLIGTLLWLLLARSNGAHVSLRVVLGFLVLIIAASCIGVYMQNPAMSSKLPAHLVSFSVLCFASCLILYFVLLLCSSSEAPTASETLNRDVKGLVERAESRAR